MRSMLKQIWDYRYFIWSSVRAELRLRHSRSRLGFLWMFIHPLFQAGLYIVVLSGVMSHRLGADGKGNYAVYLLSGTIAWALFSEIVNRSLNLFIDNAQLIKKAAFPKISLPVSVVVSALINNLLLFVVIVLLFLLFFQKVPSFHYLFLLASTLINVLLALGIGLLFGSINVFIRDIGQLVPLGMMVLYWGTPIVYRPELAPRSLQFLQTFNPFFYLIDSYHSVLVFEQMPNLTYMLTVGIVAFVIFLLGLRVFAKAGPEMVDVL